MNYLNCYKHLNVFFNGTFGTWKTDSVDFELKDNSKPICSILYPVPKVHKKK